MCLRLETKRLFSVFFRNIAKHKVADLRLNNQGPVGNFRSIQLHELLILFQGTLRFLSRKVRFSEFLVKRSGFWSSLLINSEGHKVLQSRELKFGHLFWNACRKSTHWNYRRMRCFICIIQKKKWRWDIRRNSSEHQRVDRILNSCLIIFVHWNL
jgi:hypothetical protein